MKINVRIDWKIRIGISDFSNKKIKRIAHGGKR